MGMSVLGREIRSIFGAKVGPQENLTIWLALVIRARKMRSPAHFTATTPSSAMSRHNRYPLPYSWKITHKISTISLLAWAGCV